MEERKEGLATYSAKVDPDIKTLLQSKIEESGKTAGEFISALLASYETSQSRESVFDVRELNQLRNHVARIEEIYVSMAKSRKDIEESSNISISTLQEELRAVKADLHDLQKSSKEEMEALQIVTAKEVEEAQKQAEIALSEFDKLREARDRADKQADAMTETLEQQKHLITELRDTAEKAKTEAEKANTSHQIIWEENQTLKTQIRDITAQAQIDKANAVSEAMRETAQEIKALHERIEALQNDKLKLTEQLASEREKAVRLEALADNEDTDENGIRIKSPKSSPKGKAERKEPREPKE